MPTLKQFNESDAQQALRWIAHCVAIPDWQQQIIAQRPYASLAQLQAAALTASELWGKQELDLALTAHPRIGERPEGRGSEASASRDEQSAVQEAEQVLKQLIAQGNQQYEQRFQRVFLIRAKGRSPEEIVDSLQQRLSNSDNQEVLVSLQQLREITLLRLQEAFQ